MGIRLSEKHGVNPALELCFICQKDKGVVLFGCLPDDAEAPRKITLDQTPCDECRGYMDLGIICISVDPAKSKVLLRDHKCLSCHSVWTSEVRYSSHTPNLSAELS